MPSSTEGHASSPSAYPARRERRDSCRGHAGMSNPQRCPSRSCRARRARRDPSRRRAELEHETSSSEPAAIWVVVDVIVVDVWIDYYDGLVVGIVGDELWVVVGCAWERGLRSFARLVLSPKQRARLVERAPQLDFWMAREIHAVVRDRALPALDGADGDVVRRERDRRDPLGDQPRRPTRATASCACGAAGASGPLPDRVRRRRGCAGAFSAHTVVEPRQRDRPSGVRGPR